MNAQRVKSPDDELERSSWLAARLWAGGAALAVLVDDWQAAVAAGLTAGLALLIGFLVACAIEIEGPNGD